MKLKTLPLVVLVLLVGSVGCNTVGPRAVRTARQPYNEALAMARDQEVLWNLLRIAEGKKPHFLKVDTLATKYQFDAGATVGLGLTDTLARADSLKGTGGTAESTTVRTDTDVDAPTTGLSGAWQEQPSVTYKPLDGKDFSLRLLAPVSLENLALLFEAGFDGQLLVELFVSRAGEFFADDSRFASFARLVGTLQRHQHLQFLAIAGRPDKEGKPGPSRLFIVLRAFDDPDLGSREACEFSCMLGHCPEKSSRTCAERPKIGTDAYRKEIHNKQGRVRYLNVSGTARSKRDKPGGSSGERGARGLASAPSGGAGPRQSLIATRSLSAAVRYAFGAAPTGHGPVDLVANLCGADAAGSGAATAARFSLSCSENRPASATELVAVSYRGKWFSITEGSNDVYLLFSLIYTMQAAEPAIASSTDIVIGL